MENELLNLHKKYDAIKARDKYPYAQQFLKDVYPLYFNPRKKDQIKILEIGVYNGGALEALRDYFPNSQLIGIDIIDRAKEKITNWDRVRFFQGDQKDEKFLKILGTVEGSFNFIIDDGSHIYDDQVLSFNTLFPYLTSNGVYFIEDTIDVWNGKRIIDYFYSLIPYNFPISFEEQSIKSISFYQGLIAICKV